MNVLSLFDGISCGQVALNRLGIKYDKYFASEIEKNPIAITQYNYPKTIQLGDVRKVNGYDLPKIDLLFAGPPCQDLSIAKKDRKGLAGERSGLFWEFIRILKEVKPKYFIVENVASMPKKDLDIMTSAIGVMPIKINSALVSAQQRVRLYWTNIKGDGGLFGEIPQPQDKGIVLKDILIDGYTKKGKSYAITASYYNHNKSFGGLKNYFIKSQRQLVFTKPIQLIGGSQGNRIYSIDGKSICLSANGGGKGAKTGLYKIKDYVRALYPIEAERLQTLPDNYTKFGRFGDKIKEISRGQRLKLIGNGWTVDVIAHILSYLKWDDK